MLYRRIAPHMHHFMIFEDDCVNDEPLLWMNHEDFIVNAPVDQWLRQQVLNYHHWVPVHAHVWSFSDKRIYAALLVIQDDDAAALFKLTWGGR